MVFSSHPTLNNNMFLVNQATFTKVNKIPMGPNKGARTSVANSSQNHSPSMKHKTGKIAMNDRIKYRAWYRR